MKSKLRILNLEDNATDAELNEAMISARWPESQFIRVQSREPFIAELERGDFDLILSDYTMPGFNGREALALAQEKCPKIPFLFVSGTIGEDAAIEALKNGATDYVLKHRLMRLIPAVDRALRETEERAECERAQEAMRQSEYKYRELFESLGDAAFLVDDQTRKIIDTNRQAEKMLGCNRADILGRKESQFLSAGTGRPEFEQKLTRADGTSTMINVITTPLKLYNRALLMRLCHENQVAVGV
jgi:CheY-like chemotaxis protein